jgi:hypothetical protein
VDAGFNRDPQLGADPVGGRDQKRIGEAGCLQIEDAAEPADGPVGARPRGRTGQRLDRIDEAIAGIDVDTRVAVGERAVVSRLADGFLRCDPL